MRKIDASTITPAVVERIEGCSDPRLKEVLVSLVRHLHDFARDVRLTEDELMKGLEFLTATGQKCDRKRQEFILLSDALGLSMLTVALNEPPQPVATESTVFGPFHVPDAPRFALGDDLAAGAGGAPLLVDALVRGPDGEPVAGATVDVWHSDDEGFYDVQRPELTAPRARGVLRTDAQGRLYFRTRVPVAYPIPTDGPVGRMLEATGRHPWRPAHVHFLIQAPGYRRLITQVFRGDDKYLDSDAVFGVRSSLVGCYEPQAQVREGEAPAYVLRYEFVLARDACAQAA